MSINNSIQKLHKEKENLRRQQKTVKPDTETLSVYYNCIYFVLFPIYSSSSCYSGSSAVSQRQSLIKNKYINKGL